MPAQLKRLNASIGADLHEQLRKLATSYDTKISSLVRDSITLFMYILRHPLHDVILTKEPEALVSVGGTEVREPLLPAMPRRRRSGEKQRDDLAPASDVLTLSIQRTVHDRLADLADTLGVTISDIVKHAITLQLRLFDARRRSLEAGEGDVSLALVRSTNGNWRDAEPSMSVLILDIAAAVSPQFVAAEALAESGSTPAEPAPVSP